MTMNYAHIHDSTLKKTFMEMKTGVVVNVEGHIIRDLEGIDEDTLLVDEELEWFKRVIQAQSLPNGYCALPIGDECPHANACLQCHSFRTNASFLPILTRQQKETEMLIRKSDSRGWERHSNMNKKVLENLNKIILTLQGTSSHECGSSKGLIHIES